MPIRMRVMNSWYQLRVTAPPMGVIRQKMAETKIVPRRPSRSFAGSFNQQPRKAEPMYGAELTRPTSHSLLGSYPGSPTASGMPNSIGNERLAPLDPVWSQPWTAAPTEASTTVMMSARGWDHLCVFSRRIQLRSSSVSSGMDSNLPGVWPSSAPFWKSVTSSKP